MTNAPVTPIEPLRVAEGEILHDPRQGPLPNLDCRVDVVIEQTECVDTVPKPFRSLLNQETELRFVYIVIEHIILGIPPQDDMSKIRPPTEYKAPG
jgi:hypothetical protein